MQAQTEAPNGHTDREYLTDFTIDAVLHTASAGVQCRSMLAVEDAGDILCRIIPLQFVVIDDMHRFVPATIAGDRLLMSELFQEVALVHHVRAAVCSNRIWVVASANAGRVWVRIRVAWIRLHRVYPNRLEYPWGMDCQSVSGVPGGVIDAGHARWHRMLVIEVRIRCSVWIQAFLFDPVIYSRVFAHFHGEHTCGIGNSIPPPRPLLRAGARHPDRIGQVISQLRHVRPE